MTNKLPTDMSGQDMVKFLIDKLGYIFVKKSKKNHIKLTKMIDGKKKIAIIPDHKILKPGMLRVILNQVGLDKEEFIDLLK
ncbi:MAG: type II toxin-antitoxin system HicA family toxin [Nanoarchaeota archaeon]|nr:type II toxin-antitoxin system HicA family toxin [Nanoarchaeota archaeon]